MTSQILDPPPLSSYIIYKQTLHITQKFLEYFYNSSKTPISLK